MEYTFSPMNGKPDDDVPESLIFSRKEDMRLTRDFLLLLFLHQTQVWYREIGGEWKRDEG